MADSIAPGSEESEAQGTLCLNFQETLTLDGASATVKLERPAKNVFLRPLSFPEPETKDLSHFVDSDKDFPIVCMIPACLETFGAVSKPTLCEERVGESERCREVGDSEQRSDRGSKVETSRLQFGPKDSWLRHLLLSHKIVIDKVSEISSLKSYSLYWKTRFSQAPISEFAAVIRTNSTNDAQYDPPDNYYLISDVLPEEKQLRQQLQQKKLVGSNIADSAEGEREDTNFFRSCLFCSHTATGNRSNLFQHMLETHSFSVGQPDNLVFVNEFLDLLQEKLNNFQCLYCERRFRDYLTLKEHMRKKQHKKIDSHNHTYDCFYVINYLELGKTWEEVQAEDDREILPQMDESEWSDWQESEGSLIFCLFCQASSQDLPSTLEHMRASHGFDYHHTCRQLNLDYYGQVKVINYIRRQVHMQCCCYCKERYHSDEELTQHMHSLEHYMLPSNTTLWNQAQYFFPTFENDAFLFALEDIS